MSELDLVRVTEQPLNAETPLAALAEALTPASLFYVRNNFAVPRLDPSAWRLSVGGLVEEPLELSLAALQAMGSRSQRVTLECAGNARALMDPLPPGTRWGLGAVSTGRFRGVPLATVLGRVRPREGAAEVVFWGADEGEVEPGRSERFVRSLPLADALRPRPLLVWALNDEALPPAHGAPVRLVVPGWYGMASVKWLTRIEVTGERFDGWFQRNRYVYEGEAGLADGTPVTRMRVRSVIARPADGAALPRGPVEIAGTAWSGDAAIARVEVSTEGGASWAEAELASESRPGLAAAWRLAWEPEAPGEHVIVAQATDAEGATQPLTAVWNAHGYGNNVAHRVRVSVE